MIHLVSSTSIYRPIKHVFEFISVPENDFLWQYGTLASAQLSAGDPTAGVSFRSIGHFMGQRMQSIFEVTEYEPNSRYAFKSVSGILDSQTSYSFEMKRGGTVVSQSIQVRMIDPNQISEGVLEKKMKKQSRENLTLLKDILEGR